MATDSFTGTTGTELLTYSSNWNVGNMLASDFVIDTNAVRTPLSRNVTLFAFYGGTWATDHYAQATITTVGAANSYMGVCVRASYGSAYTFMVDNADWLLEKTVSFGVPTLLASGSVTTAPGDVLKIEANGQRIRAYINGTGVADVTDSALTSGAPGISGKGEATVGTLTLLDLWTGLEIVNGVGWTSGAGTTLATDDVGGVHHQRQKWTHGADGTATDTTATAPMLVRLAPVASGGTSAYKMVSATGTNGASVKGSAGVLHGVIASNTNSSTRFLKLYDKASAPTVGTDTPKLTIAIPRTHGLPLAVGVPFSAGIAVAVTTGAADSDTGGVTANEIAATVLYS